jgi:hypothetical protein
MASPPAEELASVRAALNCGLVHNYADEWTSRLSRFWQQVAHSARWVDWQPSELPKRPGLLKKSNLQVDDLRLSRVS